MLAECILLYEIHSALDERDIIFEKNFTTKTNETTASLFNSDLGITSLVQPKKKEGVKFIPISNANFVREIVFDLEKR